MLLRATLLGETAPRPNLSAAARAHLQALELDATQPLVRKIKWSGPSSQVRALSNVE
ncbi:hypothetical protein THIX_30135 [Thiomonas sp. X19]|nr:hypothetical protein THIX_30135 [Thiomonas sp. X19]